MSSPPDSIPPAKSPILAAIGISLVIAAGTAIGSIDMATVEDVLSGKRFTRPFAETQQSHSLSIAALKRSVGVIESDVDFVASRAVVSMRRNEEQMSDRIAHLDFEIAALREKIAVLQQTRTAPRRADAIGGLVSVIGDISGLRSSLHDLATAHTGAVAAITRRLDRIEVAVGLATDMTSSVSDPKARRIARPLARPVKKPETAPPAETAQGTERGHILFPKPISQQTPLRGSKLPG